MKKVENYLFRPFNKDLNQIKNFNQLTEFYSKLSEDEFINFVNSQLVDPIHENLYDEGSLQRQFQKKLYESAGYFDLFNDCYRALIRKRWLGYISSPPEKNYTGLKGLAKPIKLQLSSFLNQINALALSFPLLSLDKRKKTSRDTFRLPSFLSTPKPYLINNDMHFNREISLN